jgi:hypothetical protein
MLPTLSADEGWIPLVDEPIGSDLHYASEPELGPDEATRARLGEFAHLRLKRR